MKRPRAVLFARPNPSRSTHRLLSHLRARDLNEVAARLLVPTSYKPITFFDIIEVKGIGKTWIKAFCEQYSIVGEYTAFEQSNLPSFKWIYSERDKAMRANKALLVHLNRLLKSSKFFGFMDITKRTQFMIDTLR